MAVDQVGKLLNSFKEVSDSNVNVQNLYLLDTLLREKNSIDKEDLENVSVDIFFSLLSSTQADEEVKVICSILRQLLGKMTYKEIIIKLFEKNEVLEKAFTHPFDGVKILALEQVIKVVDENNNNNVNSVSHIVQIALNLITHPSQEVVIKCKALYLSTMSYRGFSNIYSPEFIKLITSWMAKDEIVRYRIYDVLVECTALNQSAFDFFYRNTNILEGLATDISSNDPLVAANALEELSKMSSRTCTDEFMSESKIYFHVSNITKDLENTFASLCVPFALKFWGMVAKNSQNDSFFRIFEEYGLYDAFIKCLQCEEENINMAALHVMQLSVSCESGLGVKIYDNVLLARSTFKFLNSTNIVMRNTCLNAVAMLFLTPETEGNRASLFNSFQVFMDTEKVKQTLVNLGRHPFNETRYAVYDVLLGLTSHKWGAEALVMNSGFVEFILDRSTEQERKGQERKYRIAQSLFAVCDPHSNPELARGLRTFVEEGIVINAPQATIATENA